MLFASLNIILVKTPQLQRAKNGDKQAKGRGPDVALEIDATVKYCSTVYTK